jgi:alpha-tubulin suppressor-like RCC1 family protein
LNFFSLSRFMTAPFLTPTSFIQASCGENISALLSSTGHLYTAGASEFGQLGNGETGEHIVTAGKVGFANSGKFIRRSVFVQSEADRDGIMSSMMTSGAVDSATGRVKCVTLEDSSQICLSSISCGRNHVVAVEAPTVGHSHVPRVFSWGSGGYGCLGHVIQADEYFPRLVAGFRGPIFANNHPVLAVAGCHCSLVLTKQGHVYYVGKHKTAGEATMRPTLVDALANNGHEVIGIGAGNQTVFCSTKNGVTVSWGHGNHGELGYGKDDAKSSSKPKFVNGLDSCLVTSVSCGMGHTLFIIRNEDDEDAKALKKVGKVEVADVAQFVEQCKGKKVDADDADGGEAPAKKKSRTSKGGKK